MLSLMACNRASIAKLTRPKFPEPLRYLYDWWLEAGIMGRNDSGRLTWEGVGKWAELMKHRPEPHEWDAIAKIDSAWQAGLVPPKDEYMG